MSSGLILIFIPWVKVYSNNYIHQTKWNQSTTLLTNQAFFDRLAVHFDEKNYKKLTDDLKDLKDLNMNLGLKYQSHYLLEELVLHPYWWPEISSAQRAYFD